MVMERLTQERNKANGQTPILMAHGTVDPMIPITKGIRTKQDLLRLGYPVEWHDYPMMHGVCMEEIHDIRSWLLKILV